MGGKYEVSIFTRVPTERIDDWGMRYVHIAFTEWLIVALFISIRQKMLGCKCVKIEWR